MPKYDDDDFIKEPVAARIPDVHPDTMKKWRLAGKGPDYHRIGNRIRYRVRDVNDWLASKRRPSK